jgi:hypothetical protein
MIFTDHTDHIRTSAPRADVTGLYGGYEDGNSARHCDVKGPTLAFETNACSARIRCCHPIGVIRPVYATPTGPRSLACLSGRAFNLEIQ